jgi:hypothetical protein
MINNLHFFGCSVTAGNELWEEANIPNYAKLSFDEARKASKNLSYNEVRAYNNSQSFPALIAKELNVQFENHGIPGISNKEIAFRALSYFPEDHYPEGTVVILQFTSHNRMFLQYKENGKESTVGSFVVHHKIDDDRLSRGQNNLLKEMYLEFFSDTIMGQDDHIFMFYTAEALIQKGIKTYIIWPTVTILENDWGKWNSDDSTIDTDQPVTIKNDIEPQFFALFRNHIARQHIKYNPLRKSLMDIVGTDAQLPRYHFKQEAHIMIANALVEKLKNV